MSRALAVAALVVLCCGSVAEAQGVLGRTPNLRGEWTLARWQMAFILNHRFEVLSGGDELISIPTLTLGLSLPAGFAAGVDFTSNSEVVPERLGGNESQLWLTAPLIGGERQPLRSTVAYNHAARSADAALTGTGRLGSLSLIGEVRGFSNFLGTGDAGGAAAAGVVVHITPHLEVGGDVARAFSPDTLGTVWSGGVAVRIPGTPHTFSLHAANAGALTLQGLSRPKVLGPQDVRYGFTFTIPLGTRSQWGRIFQREPRTLVAAESDTNIAARIEMRNITFAPREVRIRAGEGVAWYNRDPDPHTVTANDRSWRSGLLGEGERYVRVFTTPGRYEYFCEPHPQMTGVIVVEAP